MRTARILGAEAALQGGFAEVAELAQHRCDGREEHDDREAHRGGDAEPAGDEHDDAAGRDAGDEPAEKPGPGLLGTDPGPQLRPAEAPAGEIGRDVGQPHHREHPQDCDEPEARMLAHERRHDRDHRRVGEAGGGPAAVAPAPAERRGSDERGRRRSPPRSAARRRRTRSPPGRRARRRARPGGSIRGSALVMASHSKSTAPPARSHNRAKIQPPTAVANRATRASTSDDATRRPSSDARRAGTALECSPISVIGRSGRSSRRNGARDRHTPRSRPGSARRRSRARDPAGRRIRRRPICQSRKFEIRCSPEVRMTRSGSGMPIVSSAASTVSALIAAGSISPRRTFSAMARTARTISWRPP